MKLRVWHMPRVGGNALYIPVTSPKEGKKVMDLLGAYDCFLENNDIRGDYSNASGLEVYNEEDGEWEDWCLDTGDRWFDNVDDYLEDDEECIEFEREIFSQVHFN